MTFDPEATHFHKRCRERGIVKSDTDKLWHSLRWAISNKRDDLAEYVKTLDGTRFYRFRCPDGIFYAAVSDAGKPMTIYTQDMMRGVKGKLKRRKRPRTRR